MSYQTNCTAIFQNTHTQCDAANAHHLIVVVWLGLLFEGGAFSDIIENINVSEVNDHSNLPISSLVEESHQARKFVGIYLTKLHLTCPFQDKRLL